MNIAMLTNTFKPHVGGVAESVLRFTEGYRKRGHRVLVVAPEYDEETEDENNVVRMTSIDELTGSDFTIALPVSPKLRQQLDDFAPQILHSHQPFLVGDTAVRLAASRDLPLVFTYHTNYEHYTRYAPVDTRGIQKFIIELSTGYSNLCDRVIAPSESVAEMLRSRGVTTPIRVIPTGVEVDRFAKGDKEIGREKAGIPREAFVVGHVGRLAPEKNLVFLAESISRFLNESEYAHAMIVGSGPSQSEMEDAFQRGTVADRVHFTGVLKNQELVDAYHAMDVFAFASHTETQGMVLVEAMAAGNPVVALDAPGAREVVQDQKNGCLLDDEDRGAFSDSLKWVENREETEIKAIRKCARSSAKDFDIAHCVEDALELYEEITSDDERKHRPRNTARMDAILDGLAREWELWSARLKALARAATPEEEDE
ncbi:MAG: glycosyltransferase [Candidatus Brocadiia bacterium]